MKNKTKNDRKTILFDLDGVLVDSFQSIFQATKSYPNMIDLTEAEYRGYFEGNFFEKYSKIDTHRQISNKQFYKAYMPKFLRLPAINSIPEILKSLSKDYRLVIVSSTVSSPIKEWLVKNKLDHFFTEIMGSDVHKSKVEKINLVFRKYHIKASDCVFITDTLGDVLEAKQAGVDSLAVIYGFHDKKTLQKGRPTGFIATPQDMIGEIKKYWKKQKI